MIVPVNKGKLLPSGSLMLLTAHRIGATRLFVKVIVMEVYAAIKWVLMPWDMKIGTA